MNAHYLIKNDDIETLSGNGNSIYIAPEYWPKLLMNFVSDIWSVGFLGGLIISAFICLFTYVFNVKLDFLIIQHPAKGCGWLT
jgi:hypothetical protein